MRRRFKQLAAVLAVVLAAFVVYAVTTKADGTFDATSDVATMKKRLAARVGIVEKKSVRAAKKTERALKKEHRRLKRAPSGDKGAAGKKFKRSMDQL